LGYTFGEGVEKKHWEFVLGVESAISRKEFSLAGASVPAGAGLKAIFNNLPLKRIQKV
jgi:hypothetical protein